MKFSTWWPWGKARPPVVVPSAPSAVPKPKFAWAAFTEAVKVQQAVFDAQIEHFKPALHPPEATPDKSRQMAMDSSGVWAAEVLDSVASEGLLFLGYPYLSELTQRPEYRVISETIATEMTRKWIEIKSSSKDGGKTEEIKELNKELERLNTRDLFKELAIQDGFFGRSHLFIDLGQDPMDGSSAELKTPIGDGTSDVTKAKIKKGSLRKLKTIEAVWTYPTTYNAINPLRDDWYRPMVWYVMGSEIHASRLLTFIGHPVPDLLKPAYSFGGLSLSQLAKPYVDIWLTTRQSVGSLIHSFSVMVLKTDLEAILQDAGNINNLMERVNAFNLLRDNQGTFVINNESEDFANVSASLAGLHELQAQSQEHMMSVARIPAVKFTGISPSGLNASSEGEIRAFYDTIAANQEAFFRPHLTTVFRMAQLNIWGKVDDDLTFEFVPLWALTEKEQAELRHQEAQTDQIYVDMGGLAPQEIRERLASDPGSPYDGIDVDDMPDLGEEELEGLEPPGGRPAPAAQEQQEKGAGEPVAAAKDLALDDAGFEETKHPRDNDGKFAKTAGGGGDDDDDDPLGPLGSAMATQQIAKAKGFSHSPAQFNLGVFEAGMAKPDGSALKISGESGKWTLASPGHMTKVGENPEGLKALLSGGDWKAHGVKNYAEGQGYPSPIDSGATSSETGGHEALHHEIAKVRPKPTGVESSAISYYKGVGYTPMNSSLRKTGKHTPETQKMHNWLARAEIPLDCTLYRGVKGEYAAVLKSIVDEGTTFRDRGFISTSTSEMFSKNWGNGSGNILMAIDVKKGQRGAAIRSVNDSDGEYEIVLQDDSKLKVISFDMAAGTMHCELVQDVVAQGNKAHEAPKPAPAPSKTAQAPAQVAKPSSIIDPGVYKSNPLGYKLVGKNKYANKKPGSKSAQIYNAMEDGMTVAQLTKALNLPKSAIYAYLDSFVTSGHVKVEKV